MNKDKIAIILFVIGVVLITFGILFDNVGFEANSQNRKINYEEINSVLLKNGYTYVCGGDDCSISVGDGEIEHRWILYSEDKHFENVEINLYKMNSNIAASTFFRNYNSSADRDIKNHITYSTAKYTKGEYSNTSYNFLVKEGKYILFIEGDFTSDDDVDFIIDKLGF